MNKTTTVLVVSAAVVVGLVMTGLAAVMFTPAGYALFGVTPWWGYPAGHYGGMHGPGCMHGWGQGPGAHAHPCGCPWHAGPGTTYGPGMMHGPGTAPAPGPSEGDKE